MTATLFSSGPLLTPQGLEQELALIADGDRIAWIGASGKAPPADHAVDLAGRILIPGFIDLQVNGGGGVLFNDTPSPEGLAAIARAHHRFGTTAMLPTLISDSLDVVAAGIAAVDEAIARRTPGVIGIHIEGPYLNPSRKGIHDDSLFVRPNLGDIQRLCTLTSGSTMVTLAPEMVPVGFIAALAERGVRVSAGHTEATYAQIAEALTSGLTGFTHLFNAMPPMLNRTPGTLGPFKL